ncbi:glycosyltransferase family 39 protein [Variovorax paradoxus]|uniref:glycosyltransferase family 39 protein n=1 Tax=Variovorax paradoxus TaxID=34073 RepID=UPI0029C920EE|nr:glycosyltransferase family 39 protein [Variovorax paradoxus]WPH18099.1 glycosyltransferase family 39 protein [Variovorax paradoxus]
MAEASLSGWGLGVLFVVFVGVWFGSLGLRSLIHTDEGRYAALALEMARSGDWITPRLNGLLYFEKPAFQYWIGALSFQTFGVNEFSARLWPGLAGFLTVAVVGFTAGRLWGRESGIRALAICASTTWIVGNSHFLTLDAGLTLFLTLVLCAVLLADCAKANPSSRRRWIWVAWAAMAGAVLSKGLVGIVIPGCALVLVSLWRRDFGLWRRMHMVSGALIFLALTSPWFVLVSLRNPGFAEFFFIHEHFTRYLTNVHRREGAWWYYLPLLFAGFLPWTSGLPWLMHSDKSGAGSNDIMARHMLVAWCGFVLVFFSVSGSKLPSYILPMFPALALLLAQRLRDANVAVLRWHLLLPTLFWVIVLIASTQIHRLRPAGIPTEVMEVFGAAMRIAALLYLVGAAIAWCCLRRRQVTAALLGVAMGHLLATTVVMQSHDAYGQLKSAAPFAEALLRLIDQDTPVFAVRSYDQTLPFYLQRNVVLVDYADEFAFGQLKEPGKSITSLDDFVVRWQSLPRAAAYMSHDTWRELGQGGLPMRVVFEDQRRLVVTKP